MPEHGLHGNRVDGDDGVEIHPSKTQAGAKGFLATLQALLHQVPSVIVQGIPTVERAVVEKLMKDDKSVLHAACAFVHPGCRPNKVSLSIFSTPVFNFVKGKSFVQVIQASASHRG